MEPEDEKWITDNINEVEEKSDGQFKGTIFMSTDNKHTVSIEADSKEGRKAGLKWAKLVYDKLIYTYGSKQRFAAKEYNAADKEEKSSTVQPSDPQTCSHEHTEIKVSHSEKNPGRKFQQCKDCRAFLGWR